MKIKDFLILIGIIGIIAVAVSLASMQLATEYLKNAEISKLEEFNSINDLKNKTQSLYEGISGGGFSFTSLGGILLNGIGIFFSMVLNIITTPIKWMMIVAEIFEIPPIFVYAAASLIIIVVILSIIALVMRKEP